MRFGWDVLAKEVERFRRAADRDEGSSGAPGPTSQRNGARLRNYDPLVTSARLPGGAGVVEREMGPTGSPRSQATARWSRRRSFAIRFHELPLLRRVPDKCGLFVFLPVQASS